MTEKQEMEELQGPEESIEAGARGKGGKRKVAGIVMLVLMALGASGGAHLWLKSLTHISTDNAFVEAHVYSLSARVPGNVTRVTVDDNQQVRKGDLLVELDAADYRAKESDAAAALAMAQNETSGDYAQVAAARADVNLARANQAQADVDLTRARNLYGREVLSKEQLDRAETARKVAQSQVRAAEEAMRKAQAMVGAAPGGKEARVAQKAAQLEQSRLNLSYTKIYAPADGYITKKSVEQGNNVQAGQPLLALVALNDPWVVANYKERQLTHVKPGQMVEFEVDAYPGRTFRGRVDSIMAGTGAAFSLLPPENATGNYVKVVQRIPVKIVIDKASDPTNLLRVGMSIVPTIVIDASPWDILFGKGGK